MKVLEHGIYYYDTVKISCIKCKCKYVIKKDDIKKYVKPKKVKIMLDDVWTDKYEYYTNCPECDYDNHLGYKDYDILTTNIRKWVKNGV